jgi:hypothetical protein
MAHRLVAAHPLATRKVVIATIAPVVVNWCDQSLIAS